MKGTGRACAIIPAYNAEETVGPVVKGALALLPMARGRLVHRLVV